VRAGFTVDAGERLELLERGRLLLAVRSQDDVLLRVALEPEDPAAPPYAVDVRFEHVGDRFGATADAPPVERPGCSVDFGTILEATRDGDRHVLSGDFGRIVLDAESVTVTTPEEGRVSVDDMGLAGLMVGDIDGDEEIEISNDLAGVSVVMTILVETPDETNVWRVLAGVDQIVVMTPEDDDRHAVTSYDGEEFLPVLLELTRLNVHLGLLGATATPTGDLSDEELVELTQARVRLRALHLEGEDVAGGELDWMDLGAGLGVAVFRTEEDGSSEYEGLEAWDLLEEIVSYLPAGWKERLLEAEPAA